MSAIDWWISILKENRVEYLMIVPNNVGDRMLTVDRRDFQEIVENHGYRLIAKEPKFLDAIVQEYGINPTFHYIFRLH